jgi:3-oxoacyl-[acyl-carrier protein] reductase
VLCVRGDVALDADCKKLVETAVTRWNRLDALVNNAGITTFVGGGSWDALDADIFQRIFAVNLLGTFQMVRASLSHLKAARAALSSTSHRSRARWGSALRCRTSHPRVRSIR